MKKKPPKKWIPFDFFDWVLVSIFGLGTYFLFSKPKIAKKNWRIKWIQICLNFRRGSLKVEPN